MRVKIYVIDPHLHNCGDMLTQPILEHLGYSVDITDRNDTGKLLGVGSIMTALRPNDIIWGTGCIREAQIKAVPSCRFAAVRGPLSRAMIKGARVPEIYGDPALLLPLLYDPQIEQIHDVGYVPHYKDRGLQPEGYWINITNDWHDVVDGIKSCKTIVSSSLHGIIIAEAYGIPAVWAKYSDMVIGGEFKFQDYFLGTGREKQILNNTIPQIENLEEIQRKLQEALWNTLGK